MAITSHVQEYWVLGVMKRWSVSILGSVGGMVSATVNTARMRTKFGESFRIQLGRVISGFISIDIDKTKC